MGYAAAAEPGADGFRAVALVAQARLEGTTGDPDEIIANGAGKGTVIILATDKAFQISGCQNWRRIG
ncbi:hypothetical protein [Streptomyces sp. NPDC048266]|uniref:hypothetical protein n=1 Tax=Streptomyces sp. NPDC048266 TaxID=3155787 RepID=UPI0033D3069B